jgi:competence protein CoiA
MLKALYQSSNNSVLAWDAQKQDKPFNCPNCKSEVTLKKGRVVTHHFAHKPPITCSYGAGESEGHRQCKYEIYNNLMEDRRVTKCEMERYLDEVRPDISCFINNTPVAIEVQISSLSMDEIISRTVHYEEKNIYVLWLALFNDKLNKEKYRPQLWEKWVHATYYGNVYYWLGGLDIIPVHFGDHYRYVNESTWYESDGEERSAGGYDKKSKAYKIPTFGNSLSLTSDFVKEQRGAWNSEKLEIPKAKIYMSKTGQWWKRE